ncbi:hypothetical protein H4R33_003775 [Dimargaris cristalligena]|nr:hypothetical protein H4R33_003775 [Dimargaris cristalligena]
MNYSPISNPSAVVQPSEPLEHSFASPMSGTNFTFQITNQPDGSNSAGSTPAKKRSTSADRRANHNKTERTRRELLNSDFQLLAKEIPKLDAIRRPSKSQIVQASCQYVRKVKQRTECQEREIQRLAKENEALHQQLNELRVQLGLPPLTPPSMPTFANTAMLDHSSHYHHQQQQLHMHLQHSSNGENGLVSDPALLNSFELSNGLELGSPQFSETDGEHHHSGMGMSDDEDSPSYTEASGSAPSATINAISTTTASVNPMTIVGSPSGNHCGGTLTLSQSPHGLGRLGRGHPGTHSQLNRSLPPNMGLHQSVFFTNMLGIQSDPLSPHSPLGLSMNMGLLSPASSTSTATNSIAAPMMGGDSVDSRTMGTGLPPPSSHPQTPVGFFGFTANTTPTPSHGPGTSSNWNYSMVSMVPPNPGHHHQHQHHPSPLSMSPAVTNNHMMGPNGAPVGIPTSLSAHHAANSAMFGSSMPADMSQAAMSFSGLYPM